MTRNKDRTVTVREFAHIFYDSVMVFATSDLTYKGYPIDVGWFSPEELRREFASGKRWGSVYLMLKRGWSVEPQISIDFRDEVLRFEVSCSGTGRSIEQTRTLIAAMSTLTDIACLIETRLHGRQLVVDDEADKAADADDPAYQNFDVAFLEELPKGSTLVAPTGERFFKLLEPVAPFAWTTSDVPAYDEGTLRAIDVSFRRLRIASTKLPSHRVY